MVTPTSWFATTPGNRLPIPTSFTSGAATSFSAACAAAATWYLRSRRTGGPVDHRSTTCVRPGSRLLPGRRPSCVGGAAGLVTSTKAAAPGSRRGRNLDRAALDLLRELVDLRLVGLDRRVRGGVADATVLQVVRQVAGTRVAVVDRLDPVVARDVDPLEGGRQDVLLLVGGGGEVLVGVDPDRPLAVAGLDRSVEDTAAGRTGGVVDHVGALVELTGRRGLAAGRVVEAGQVALLDIGDVDLDSRVDGLHPGGVARLERLNQVVVDTAHEADLLRLGRLDGGQTHHQRGLV